MITTFVGLSILAAGAAVAAWSAGVSENDAERIAAGVRPDYDLKWVLVRQSKRLRGGLCVIVIGAMLQMVGTLIDPLK